MTKELILLAHGDGGRLSREIVETIFLKVLGGNRYLEALDDGALLPKRSGRPVYTTDSYVVKPLFFPGGDIGMLSVFGTCNDLSVMGARPEFLSCAYILEEGLEVETLRRVAASMAEACERAGVKIVTGDTKVVERGKADGLYINTTGIGYLRDGIRLSPARLKSGDRVLVSGPIGDHGIAVLAARERLALSTPVRSDAASIWPLVEKLLVLGGSIKFMRDPTRGGLATVLCELAKSSGHSIEIREDAIPVRDEVRGICEILGFDPLYVANEGKLVLVVSKKGAERALGIIRGHPLGQEASIVGEVKEGPRGLVVLHTRVGGRRLVDMLSGEQLPRIC